MMVIPCLCLLLFSSCTVHHEKSPQTKGLAASFLVDIPTRWEPRTNQSNGLRLLIFLQPLGRALKNQNAAPTTPPCFSRWLRSSSLLFKSSYPRLLLKGNCRVKQKRQWTVCLPVDIPTGWEPRAKQQPTGLIAYGAARRRPVQVLFRTEKEKPVHIVYWFFLVQ